MKHYNPTLAENALEQFRTKSGDNLNSDVSPQIVPIVELSPKLIVRSATAATTLLTTPATEDFYLVYMGIEISAPAATTANSIITVTGEDGVNFQCLVHVDAGISESHTNSLMMNLPFRGAKLRRNTAISFAINGAANAHGIIAGYIVKGG